LESGSSELMAAPRDIIDALESVTSLYFSDVRHKQRAAFILTDELVEMCCKALALKANPHLGHIKFHQLLSHPAVQFNVKNESLEKTLLRNHDTRNKMQHVNAAFTVDDQHCADAILDAVAAIEYCFPGTIGILTESMNVSLRVIRLHSSSGNLRLRGQFEDEMRRHRWNGINRQAKISEPPVPVGIRRHWSLVIPAEYATVEAILNRIGVL
jgi:hypothetical protein